MRSTKRNVRSLRRVGEGFTLVELLIVIVVIGVLSAMMMLSSTEAVSSARASNIISNLRNLRTAALAWYTDNIDKVKVDNNGKVQVLGTDGKTYGFFGREGIVTIMDVLKYLGTTELEKGKSIQNMVTAKDGSGGLYLLDYEDSGGKDKCNKWYVVYEIPNNDTNVKQKLEARAKSIGLKIAKPGVDTKVDIYSASDTNSQYPAMLIIDFTAN